MKLIVGLGNPGKEYISTRHNVGFMAADYFIAHTEGDTKKFNKFEAVIVQITDGDKYIVAEPQTYMNASGEAVRKIADFYKIDTSDIIIIHDDLDIMLGEYKIQKGKGPKIHNGILSIEKNLNTKDFTRVRIGIDNRIPGSRTQGEEYVLSNFLQKEKEVLQKVFEEITASIKSL